MNKAFKEYKFNNGATLKNRLVLAPMTTYSSNDDLTLSDEEEIYYNSRAKQFGMVITAATAISKNAQAFSNQISIRDERYLDSMTRLAKAITKENSKAIIQLHHGGRMNVPDMYPNQDIVSASAVKANRDYCVVPRELKTSEVYDIIDDFCNATKIAIKAGFDGIELHGANTYLIQQFFSPDSNLRDDEFGGDIRKRLKFPLLLVDRVLEIKKQYANNDFIIGYRFSPEEGETPGITLDDTLLLVDELAQKDIDYLHISLGSYKQGSIRDKNNTNPVINEIVKTVNNRVPIIGVGGINSNETIEDAFSYGYELFAVGLSALADANVVDNLRFNITLNKEFSDKSLLPNNLFNRIKQWFNNNDSGYTIKEKE